MKKFTLRHSDKFVGLFILVGTLALVVSLGYVGINKRWFERDPEYRSYFATAEGLSPGLELQLRGFAIGRVKSMTLLPDDRVELILTVFNEYADRIVGGSVVCLSVVPMGFGSSLVVYPGCNGGDPLAPGEIIPSSDTPEGRSLLARGLVKKPEKRDDATKLLATLPPLMARVDSFIVSLDEIVSHLDDRLMGEDPRLGLGLMGTVDSAIRGVDGTTREFAFMATRVDSLTRLLETTLTAVNGLLTSPQGVVPAMLGDEGSAAALFQDEARLYDGMLQIMEELRLMMNFLNASTPEISALMEESTSAIVESEKLMQGLQNNPLVRGGIPPVPPAGAVFEGHRGEVR